MATSPVAPVSPEKRTNVRTVERDPALRAWVDETGAMWGAGGQFAASAKPGITRNGTVARYGDGVVSGAIDL